MQIADRAQRLPVLLIEIERLVRAVLALLDPGEKRDAALAIERLAARRDPERQLHQRLLECLRQGEGRMAGEHDPEARLLDALAELVEGHRLAGLVALGQIADQASL